MTTCCEPKSGIAVPTIDAEELAMMCKALGHPARVQLLNYLSAYGACYFGSLTDVLPLAASTISQHVSVLKHAGLIIGSADERAARVLLREHGAACSVQANDRQALKKFSPIVRSSTNN